MFIFILCLLFNISAFPQKSEYSRHQSSIILAHPTIRNIQTLLYLIDSNIFTVPEDLQIIGVYHENGEYNYQLSEMYLLENNISSFTLIKFSEQLHPGNIYALNECSDQFFQLFDQTSGIMFFGGPDIPPSCYGHETNLLTEITDPNRHYLELSMIFHLFGGLQNNQLTPYLTIRNGYAVLGICLGMQSLNVATGGTLIQDIPTEIYGLKTSESIIRQNPEQQHRNYHQHTNYSNDMVFGSFHSLNYEKTNFIDRLNDFSDLSPFIWSSHHQCIDQLGKGFVPIAYSSDNKIIEAIVHDTYPDVLGVQFHPEIISIYNDTIKLKIHPDQTDLQTYKEMFPESSGMNFHLNFWRHVSTMFFNN